MEDLGVKYVEDYLTYSPRGISTTDVGYLMNFGYMSAQIYWRDAGFPFILREFFMISPGEKLVIKPVGSHNAFDAAVFINGRILDIYEAVVRKAELGGKPVKCDLTKWQLSPAPETPSGPGSGHRGLQFWRAG